MAFIRGLDVSSCQGNISWTKVDPAFQFVVVKISEGETGQDPTRFANMKGAEDTGRLVFCYHFFRTSQDPQKQAENVWKAVGSSAPLLVFIDLETIADGLSPAQAIEKTLALAEKLESYFGRPPGLYTFPYFARSTLGPALFGATSLARCPLWMADYSGGESPKDGWSPYVPKPWDTWTFAQTSGNNSSLVPGIYGHVDHNVANFQSFEALRTFAGLPPLLPDASQVIPNSPYDEAEKPETD